MAGYWAFSNLQFKYNSITTKSQSNYNRFTIVPKLFAIFRNFNCDSFVKIIIAISGQSMCINSNICIDNGLEIVYNEYEYVYLSIKLTEITGGNRMKSPKKKSTVDGMIKAINESLERTRITLGAESALYQQQAAAVTAILSGTGAVKKGKNGETKISRGKKTEAQVTRQQLTMIKQTLSMNSLQKEKKRLTAEIRQKREAMGMKKKDVKAKITTAELQKEARRKMTMNQRFQAAVDFASDNKNLPYWGNIHSKLKALHQLKNKKDIYAAQQDIVSDIIRMRDQAEESGVVLPQTDILDDIAENGL